MQIRKHAFLCLLFAMILVFISGTAWAHGILKLRDDLNLTDKQVQGIEGLQANAVELYKSSKKSIQEKSDALDKAIYADPIDRDEVSRSIDQLVEAVSARQRAQYNYTLEVSEILTPEQRKKYLSIH